MKKNKNNNNLISSSATKLLIKKITLAALLTFSTQLSFSQVYKWAKSIGSVGVDDSSNSITTDASGNVYITGSFAGTADFDPGVGTQTLTAVGGNDIFFAKYNSNGNYLWAKGIGGSTQNDYGTAIIIDASGSVYVTGKFGGTADFDPGVGTQTLNSVSVNNGDIFLAKYDSNGNYLWAKNIGCTGYGVGSSISTDASSNVYITGYFTGTADFDPGVGTQILTAVGGNDIYFAKYNSNGNYLWAKSIGSTGEDQGYSIAMDATGNVYITGYFAGTADFDPGVGTQILTPVGGNDIYFAKYNSNGNYIWANSIGSTSYDGATSIATDASSNVYITGYFAGTADFDPGVGTQILTAVGGGDIYFAKYNSNGNYLWAKSIGSTGVDQGYSIATDASSNVYITGSFGGIADFDPGVGTQILTPVGGKDIYFAKYNSNGNYLWAKSIGSTVDDAGTSIATDASGNVYVTGGFRSTADFDPGVGSQNLTAIGQYFFGNFTFSTDIFFAKYFDCSSQPAVTAAISSSNVSCFGGSNGAAISTAAGGTAPYSYSWSNSATTFSISNLTAGSYSLTVTDSKGCEKTTVVTVTVPAILGNSTTIQNVTCNGGSNGSVILNTSGGTAPYSYLWSNSQTTQNISGLAAAVYSVTVTDAKGCIKTKTVSVSQPTAIDAFVNQQNLSCFGIADGYIAISASGGIMPYQYSMDGGINYQSSAYFMGLPAGTYTVLVSDNNLCQTSYSLLTITEPLPLNLSTSQINVSCFGAANGSASATVNGGTPAYSYSWNTTPNQNSAIASNLTVGLYSVIVQDQNNCTTTSSVSIISTLPQPNICMVTVDSVSQHNIIYWDNTGYTATDTFYVYRDIANNNFALIGKQPYSSVQFSDTVRALYLANGDPNASSWRYKIAVKDSCGIMSAMSPYHQTIFFQNNGGNFNWTPYQIEGATLPISALSNYLFKRDNLSTNNWNTIQTLSASSTLYTDLNYALYQATGNWRIETQWSIFCNGMAQKVNAVSKSRSNVKNNNTVVTNLASLTINDFKIMPNPASAELTISSPIKFTDIKIVNSVGQIVQESKYNNTVSVAELSGGIYFVQLFNENGNLLKVAKFIKE